jgi:hypothetical protein
MPDMRNSRKLIALLFLLLTLPVLADDVFSGSMRVRAESWKWFETPGADDDYRFLGAQLRVAAKKKLGPVEGQLELAAPLLMNLPEGATAPAPRGQLGLGASYAQANNSGTYAAGLFVKQAWLRYGMFKAGRFEFTEGSERMPADPQLAAVRRDRVANRLIGTFGFTHVGRSFDGVQADGRSWTILAAKPTKGVFRVHGGQNLEDVGFVYGSWSRSTAASDLRVFAIGYRDDRDVVKTDNRPAAVRAADREELRVSTIGTHYVFKRGNANFLVWGALQGGEWGTLDHGAAALDLEAGWQFPKASLRTGWFRSSGDDDPGDDEHGTFFQLLPTPRVYARFPFYNAMNSNDVFVQVGGIKVHPKVTLQAELHRLTLSNENDLWYAGGGAFEDDTFGYAGRPSNGSDDLATTLDFQAVYKPTPALDLTFYAARAFGGDVVEAIFESDDATFAYVELMWRF